jgi:anti-sigma B factor antagonist
MPAPFRVKISHHNGATVLAPSGELDLASGPELEAELERVKASELIIVDLRQLEFIDSTGLSVLVKANQQAQEAGRRFALVNGGSQIQRLLSLTGIADRLTLVETPEELLALGRGDPAEPPTRRPTADPAGRTGYSYCKASSTFRRPARRAGKIAATTPAITAAITNTTSVPTGIVNAG